MTDLQMLDEVTATFIKALIRNKFKNIANYAELEKRISNLIECERQWRFDKNFDMELMNFWKGQQN